MAAGRPVVTIEGLADEGKLTSVQQAFVDTGAIQCGFCIPGMVVAATALLAENPHPDDDAIREGLAGNLCRCSGYVKVAEAVRMAANIARSEG
jgi:carbon-monoxide dehydrogenase small subunit